MRLKGLDNLATRLNAAGGPVQQNRMIEQKRKTLQAATYYSYQGAKITPIGDDNVYQALINPNKLTLDYDEKIISTGFESQVKVGSVFRWENTGTYWIVYLQDLNELAYFRGRIRRCSHQINWVDENSGKECSTYISLVGPKNKEISSISKKNFIMDTPNYDLSIIMPKTKDALEYFQRYATFYLTGLEQYNKQKEICWRVEAVDTISSADIIEIYAKEYYSNPQEDDISKGLVGALVVKPIEPTPGEELIFGESLIQPKVEYTFTYLGDEKDIDWKVLSGNPIDWNIDGRDIKITWLKTHGGKFTLVCGNERKEVIVDSLF